MSVNRRRFLGAGALVAAASPGKAAAASPDRRVYLQGDGIPLSPAEYSQLLSRLAQDLKPDSFSLGGPVQELEERFAASLGKEQAVWLPTGTLANHLAVRLLAGEKRRVLVQHESHLLNDTGDCSQTLSGLHMIPLAPGRATFTVDEVRREVERAAGSRVSVPIGALSIESPVRRRTGEVFDFAEMKAVCRYAREQKIGLHLDGARLFMGSAYTGVAVAEYAALFDTVYVSMYKYFNAGSGAILAGPRSLLENLWHTRRMFGGGLHHVWPFATVALHFFEGFSARYQKAVATADAFVRQVEADGLVQAERSPGGSHIIPVRLRAGDLDRLRDRLAKEGVVIAPPRDPADRLLHLNVNETAARRSPDELARLFKAALA